MTHCEACRGTEGVQSVQFWHHSTFRLCTECTALLLSSDLSELPPQVARFLPLDVALVVTEALRCGALLAGPPGGYQFNTDGAAYVQLRNVPANLNHAFKRIRASAGSPGYWIWQGQGKAP